MYIGKILNSLGGLGRKKFLPSHRFLIKREMDKLLNHILPWWLTNLMTIWGTNLQRNKSNK